jgi:proteic killer suppression protein
MKIEFEKRYLRELYETGKTADKKYRFQLQVINGYATALDSV